MDRNEKIAFGMLTSIVVFNTWKIYRLHTLLNRTISVVHDWIEADYQETIDEHFENIVEHLDD